MTGWLHLLILAVYVIGWAWMVPRRLRQRMLAPMCAKCDLSGGPHYSYHPARQIRGSLRDRNGGDVAVAMVTAAFWPPVGAVAIVGVLFIALGRGTLALVNSATPLTQPELERRIVTQQAEIERLSKQIDGASS